MSLLTCPLLLAATLLPQGLPTTPPQALCVPLHTGSDAALWAARAGYKARFDGDYSVFPRGDAAAPHQPWRWQSVSIGRGGSNLLEDAPAPQHTADRYELHHGPVVEAYDILGAGVEQTFTLASRPPGRGDLVITGRVTTPLRCAPVDDAQQALVFRDARDRAVIRYSEAWAYDAAGRWIGVTTGFDGQDIRLRVPGAWLDAATFPVTVDPLTAPVDITSVPTASAPTSLSVARDASRNSHNVMVLCTYATASGDHDAVAYLVNDDYKAPALVFSETGTARDSHFGSAAFVGGADRWVLAVGDQIYFHDGGNLTLNSGVTAPNPAMTPFGTVPDTHVGGTPAATTGTRALLAWSGTWVNSPFTPEVLGAVVNAAARTVGSTFALTTMPNSGPFGVNNRSFVQVTPHSSGGSTSWIVGWREQLILANDQQVFVSRITAGGTVAGQAVAFFGLFNVTNPQDLRLAGFGGRYMIAYRKLSGLSAQENVVRPFTWSETSATPVFGTAQSLGPASGGPKQLQAMSYNGQAGAPRWLLTHAHAPAAAQPLTTDVVQLDGNGAAVETLPLPAGVEATGHTFGHGFTVVTGERTAAPTVTLRGRLLGPLSCQANGQLNSPSITKAGANYMLWITKATSMSDNTASQFAISLSPQPSVVPGIISMSIGNNFQSFFIWPEVENYGPGVCAGAWLLPSLPTMQGATVWFQGWFADFAQPSIFPLPVTNAVSVTFN